jgi:hypothetical protein
MITGYIGCPSCDSVLYTLYSVETEGDDPTKHTGVFVHELKKVGNWQERDDGTDHLSCGRCGTTLQRVGPPQAVPYNPEGE